MVNSIFINVFNEEVMFDRLQIFHQKKKYYLVQFLKVAKKNGKAAPEVNIFWSRVILKYAMAHGSLHYY